MAPRHLLVSLSLNLNLHHYLAVLFIHKKSNEALIVSARDMADRERTQYGKK